MPSSQIVSNLHFNNFTELSEANRMSSDIFDGTSPISVEAVISQSDELGQDRVNGYLANGGLLGSITLYCVILHALAIEKLHMGMKLRVASTSLVYRKVTSVANKK